MRFFTSDTHFNDSRIDIFSRPFKSVEMMNRTMVNNWNGIVGKEDDVYHLGDFSVDPEGYEYVSQLNGKIHLVLGNYDRDNIDKFDHNIFASVSDSLVMTIKENQYFLVHEPLRTSKRLFNLCGHIHGLWKVQRNMINVSTDAWHFCPVSEDKIDWQRNGILNYYDDNVFIAEYLLKSEH